MTPENDKETAEYQDIKIVAVMSVPMVGWNPHWGCVAESLRPFNIPIRMGFGAFWHQTMSNLFEECIRDGIDWVLTFDYDSMMTAEHVDRLIRVFGASPHIDALATLQCKRGTDEVPLLTTGGKCEIEINGLPIKVDTMHFGMTLFRMDSLKKVPMPWFNGRPDENGSYLTGARVDADIAFWHNWKAAGNTAYVDPMNGIGHLQPMIAEFDERFQVRHVHVVDWRKAQKEKRERAKAGAA